MNYEMKENASIVLYDEFYDFTDEYCKVSYAGSDEEQARFLVGFIQYLAHPSIQMKNYAVIDTMMNDIVHVLQTKSKMFRVFRETMDILVAECYTPGKDGTKVD